jgi:hypothetical protein
VAIFLGNEPLYDFMCQGISSGTSFSVQIKGTAQKPSIKPGAKGAWVLAKTTGGSPDDLFVFVYVAPVSKPFRFFIALRSELRIEQGKYPPATSSFTSEGGIFWRELFQFENKWEKLPRP